MYKAIVPKSKGRAAMNISFVPKMAILTKSGIMAMIRNPLATPFKTSIELIVLPAIGIIINMSGIYNNGISAFPIIRLRWLP